MGYMVIKDCRKPHYKAVVMEFKADPSEPSVRKKIVKVLVDLVLFDFELDALVECVRQCNGKYHSKCSILDALEKLEVVL